MALCYKTTKKLSKIAQKHSKSEKQKRKKWEKSHASRSRRRRGYIRLTCFKNKTSDLGFHIKPERNPWKEISKAWPCWSGDCPQLSFFFDRRLGWLEMCFVLAIARQDGEKMELLCGTPPLILFLIISIYFFIFLFLIFCFPLLIFRYSNHCAFMDRTAARTFKHVMVLENRLIWSVGNLNFPAETLKSECDEFLCPYFACIFFNKNLCKTFIK